ncbi:MAG: imidazole glycerol phosphate synthase subunit HisH [Nitrospinae bacterium]|nr:imidazole glycerol phosphate synthase subunit HisH [Nitrospinota bacterium]
MLAIINCSIGNVSSVANAFKKLGEETIISNDEKVLLEADYVVFPGVGSFKCMQNIRDNNLDKVIKKIVDKGTPFLGICLGFQVLFDESHEFGLSEGLGILSGSVLPFQEKLKDCAEHLKIPQIGWNSIKIQKESKLFKDIPDESYFYFVHSYYVEPQNPAIILSKTDYGFEYCSAVEVENVVAVQFHPEKSQKIGLQFLKNFLTK